MVVDRLEVMVFYINIQATRLLLLFLTDNYQLNVIPDKSKVVCRSESYSYFTFLGAY